MVVFALFSKKCASDNKTNSSTPSSINKSKDVLEELMALHNHYTDNAKEKDEFDTSSFILDDILNSLPAKGEKENDYKDALLNSLYAQVEYLKQESLAKNELIKTLVSTQNNYFINAHDNRSIDADFQQNPKQLSVTMETTTTVKNESNVTNVSISENSSTYENTNESDYDSNSYEFINVDNLSDYSLTEINDDYENNNRFIDRGLTHKLW